MGEGALWENLMGGKRLAGRQKVEWREGEGEERELDAVTATWMSWCCILVWGLNKHIPYPSSHHFKE